MPVSEAPTALRPPLKWAGGKRWQVPHLIPLWSPHSHRRLVEPFCGGLSVALGLSPERALLNDANAHLISFYQWLQRGLTLDLKLANNERVFYAHRKRFNALLASGEHETAEAAGLFYYLNRTGYNGLCRFNSRGEFNVPFGRYKTIGYMSDFNGYRHVLGNWKFVSGDFEHIAIDRGDFIYADPPYDMTFAHYSTGGFSWDDQVRVAEWLSKHRGPVVLVNQATQRIDRLYRKLGFTIAELMAPRRISCTGDRAPAREVIATRNL